MVDGWTGGGEEEERGGGEEQEQEVEGPTADDRTTWKLDGEKQSKDVSMLYDSTVEMNRTRLVGNFHWRFPFLIN